MTTSSAMPPADDELEQLAANCSASAACVVLRHIREANERLLLATLRADELADRTEAALTEKSASEERFRSLVTTSAAIVFEADRNGRIRVDPDGWRSLTGLDAPHEDEEEPGWGWLHAVHPDDRADVRATWSRATAAGDVYGLQHRLRRPDGSYAWVMARAVPLPATGGVREWVGTMSDVSDRVRVEESRETFIAVLGHDLRNPVNAILLSTELLLGGELPDDARRTVARVARSAGRIENMVRDIIDFAHGHLGSGIPIEPRACHLGDLARDVVGELRDARPDCTITLEVVGDASGEWDPHRLEQVLSNLIGNAVDQASTPVAVVVADQGQDVLLSIHNGGSPIPESLLPVLFEPFHPSAKIGRDRGLGLGLYIASQIARAHGTTISVSSSESEGTTMTIRWPRRHSSAEI
jgi:PAS domain S-box-containing protein